MTARIIRSCDSKERPQSSIGFFTNIANAPLYFSIIVFFMCNISFMFW